MLNDIVVTLLSGGFALLATLGVVDVVGIAGLTMMCVSATATHLNA